MSVCVLLVFVTEIDSSRGCAIFERLSNLLDTQLKPKCLLNKHQAAELDLSQSLINVYAK